MWIALLTPVILIIFIYVYNYYKSLSYSFVDKHVLITGGSAGIGLALARECVQKGAHVTIFARNLERLQAAKIELELLAKDCSSVSKIHIASVNVSGDLTQVQAAVTQSIETIGTIDVLINNAGTSMSAMFVDTSVDNFVDLYRSNVVSVAIVTKAVVLANEQYEQASTGLRIVIVSSQAGQVGICGYSAYSSSKFALFGLAQTLQMELKPKGVLVTVAFPPDTDTPGFAIEEMSKPSITRKLSSSASSAVKPSQVAIGIIKSVETGAFMSSFGVDGNVMSWTTAGMSPCHHPIEFMVQILMASVGRLVAGFVLVSFDFITANEYHNVSNQARVMQDDNEVIKQAIAQGLEQSESNPVKHK